MGTGWRRAFCTSIPRDQEVIIREKPNKRSPSTSPSPSPRTHRKIGLFTSVSNPSTPRLQSQPISPTLRCRTSVTSSAPPMVAQENPRLQCKTTTTKSPRLFQSSNPSSPRSPLKFSLFKSGSRISKSNCGICLQSMKTGQGTAIFTAECSHAFHFQCIAAHVRKPGNLVCPVCSTIWKEVPLIANLPQTQTLKKPDFEEEKEIIKRERSTSPKDQSRVYDDDEPLLSPTAGTRFNPIPEADENGGENEEEIEEFQGFFVNNPTPVRQSREQSVINGGDSRDLSRNVEVRLQPEVAVVSIGRNYETYALTVKVKAPPPPPPARNSNSAPLLDPGRRAPIDLVTVLDLSGSMTGAKLQMLKRAMRLVISSLGSSDRLAIVAFSSSPKRLLPLIRMSAHGQRSARRLIDRLICGQGTSVGEALKKATKVLEDRRERNPVASIMLLSDGQDDRLSSNPSNQRRPSSTRFAHVEIPVHAFGFGDNSGYTREPAEDAFSKCVGGLLSVVAQDLRLRIGFPHGSDPAEISAVYSYSGRPTLLLGTGPVRLGDLYAEEERELLVELRVPTAYVGAHHVISVGCCYKDPATQEVIYGQEQNFQVPQPQTVRSSNPKIERLRNLFVTTRAMAESRRLVEHKDLSGAFQLLSSARALLMRSSSISADEYLRGLEAELADLHRRRHQQQQIQHYHQQQFQRRRMHKREPAAYVDENGEPLTPTSAWRAAEKLAKVAIMRKSLNKVSDLHGFENARF
ncbi:zinc finger protein [Macleaya cordata]|uniref:Zinc finger protein n=1 Tax=Macleaya cordata TaxID=56857 RepID=A0A200R8D8_MACCD|nr:zinc finger protein [Macleaya cordata]